MQDFSLFKKSKDINGHSAAVYSIAYDGIFLYSASGDRYVTRWNLQSGIQDKFAIQFKNTPFCIALFSQNTYLAVGLENGDLHFFDLSERKEVKFFKQHKMGIFSILENPLKNQLYTADAEGNLAVWNTLSYELELFLPFACGKIRRLTLSHNREKLILACNDGMIRILETNFFNLVHSFEAHSAAVTSFAFFPKDDTKCLSGGKDAYLKAWDLNDYSCFKAIPIHNFSIYDLVFLSEDEFISCSRDKTIKIWNATNFDLLQRIEHKNGGHLHSVNQVLKIGAASFASCSDDKRILLFES
jgi:WD40 repeat protein